MSAPLAQPTLTVRCVDPTRDPAWLELLDHPSALLFHSPPWLRAVAEAYDFTIRAYLALDGTGSPVGGVPFCELDDIVGRRVVCLPFSDACDPLAESADVGRLLLAGLQG